MLLWQNCGMKTAKHWHSVEGGGVQCDLCPHNCRIHDGRSGICRVRRAEEGKLLCAGYGHVSSASLDPVEKKPFYHFHPGRSIFSVGGWGCNLTCRFCQNWSISQGFAESIGIQTPESVLSAARKTPSIGVAYTYNEPIVGFEFVMDCSLLVRAAGLLNVLVTNGYVNLEPAREILGVTDAVNLDIKSMDEEFYRNHCGGSLKEVLSFAEETVRAKTHLEITNLIIPGLNDAVDTVRSLATWIREHLGRGVPLHLSAYHPQYKCNAPATPFATMEMAYDVCRRELDYVYLGNVAGRMGQDTACPTCGTSLIQRSGYRVSVTGLRGSACASCGRNADLVIS